MGDVTLSEKAKSVKLGVHEHYKGKRYQVLGVALHSEALEELVVYKALYGEGLTWVRPLDTFLEEIEVGGVKRPRFQYTEKCDRGASLHHG